MKTFTNNTDAKWIVRDRDLNWEADCAFFHEIDARIYVEEFNSHPDVNREKLKVFYEA